MATTGTTISARDRWNAKVSAYEDGGMTKRAATIECASRYPHLHAEMLEEVNDRRGHESTKPAAAGPATERWQRLVAGYVADGFTQAEAVAHAVAENHSMHLEYLDEATAASERRRRGR